MPSPELMARLGVPASGRVRKSRAAEDQSAPSPEEITSKLGGIIYMNGVRSTCAVGDNPDHLLKMAEEKWRSGLASLRLFSHLVNPAQERAGETPQPTTSLLCEPGQYPIAATSRSQDEVHTLRREGNSQAFFSDARRLPLRAHAM